MTMANQSKTVFLILFGNIKYDGRVKKEIKSLLDNGFSVELIVSKFEDDHLSNYPFKIHTLGQKSSRFSVINFLNSFVLCFKAFRLLKNFKPDVVHCNDLNTLLAGYLYKKLNTKVLFIYDSHELYPESQKSRIRKLIWNKLEKLLLPKVDTIIMPEKNRAKYFEKKHQLKKDVLVIPNYPRKMHIQLVLNRIEDDFPQTLNITKILYIGIISSNRKLKDIALSFVNLPEKYCLILIGPFKKKSKEEFDSFISEYHLTNKIFVHDPIPNDEVMEYILSSDIGIVFYNNNNLNNYYCASNKLFEFIACRKPVITNNYPGLIEVVEQNKFGVCLDKTDSVDIAEAIKNIKPISQDIKLNYYWDDIEKSFLDIYLNT